jgi:hypothetical protein
MDLENHIHKLWVFLTLYIKLSYIQHIAHYLQDEQEPEDTTVLKDDFVDTTVLAFTCAKDPYELDKDLHMLWDSHIY